MPFDFDAAVTAPFRMQPGLRRVAPGTACLSPNEIGSAHLRAKCEILAAHADGALLALPGFDAGPVFAALAAEAVRDGSGALALDAEGRLVAARLRWAVDTADQVHGDGPREIGDCLRALPADHRRAGLASLAFAEDFAAVDGATTRIPWLAVCLPSHWSPADKIGLRLADIHRPVADNAVLVAASDALVRLVTGGERWERFVWTLTPRAALDGHPRRGAAVEWPAAPETAFLRSERQIFLPLAAPASPQALFTLRIDVTPLADAVDSPARARRLHDALASMSDAVLAYRGLAHARAPLLAWLAGRAG